MAAYKHLIDEISELFSHIKDRSGANELANKLYESEAFVKESLTPWSYSLYTTIPDFIRKQILFEREIHGSVKLAQIETEKFIAYLVDEQLKKRKKAGKYKGAFAPVTHYFGYQGRCSHPTAFDCSLGSSYGFTAGVLIENGLTGYCVTAHQITAPAKKWRVGGVPLLSLLRSQPKSGFKRSDLVVPSDEVDLSGEAYQRMKAVERQWRFIDHYSNPGPIQFYDFGSDEVAMNLKSMFAYRTKISEKINAICHSIQNDSLFAEHQHLLIAALSSLESAKSVINSMTQSMSLGAQ